MTLLTVKDMAIRLQVKEKTIYAWASQRKIPCLRVNAALRFDATEIEQWLQKSHVPIGPPHMPAQNSCKGSTKAREGVDILVESAKRAVYTSRGETRPIASPKGKERTNGAR